MRIQIFALAALLFAGCGGDDGPTVDSSGVYSVATTNRANECMFMGWTEGETAMGIPITVDQDGRSVTADVGGVAGTWLDIVFANHTFEGTISGNTLNLTLTGMRAGSMMACAYTVDGELTATLTGDALQGTILYVPQTNGSPDCGVLNTCSNRQDFSGSRPPR